MRWSVSGQFSRPPIFRVFRVFRGYFPRSGKRLFHPPDSRLLTSNPYKQGSPQNTLNTRKNAIGEKPLGVNIAWSCLWLNFIIFVCFVFFVVKLVSA